jgi:predicted nuclease of predicted toxin-antitoxin system
VSEQIRFHLDEHVDPDIARALRQHGIDASTTVEVGLRTASDPDQLAFVQREVRVWSHTMLISYDWLPKASTTLVLPIATNRRVLLGRSSAA